MRVSRRHLLRTLGASGVVAGAGFGSYGYVYERHRISVTRKTVPVSNLPPALRGLRVGLLSDIHHGEFMPAEDVSAAAALLRAEQPDMIVLAGDYVTWSDRAAVVPCAQALAPLRAPLGVFAVIGNHDPEPTVNAVFEAHGIQVLRDEHAHVSARGEAIVVGGLRFWSTKTADLERLFQHASGFPILLAHDPRRLAQAAQLGLPLILSGHTHGGQVVIPGLGAPAATRFPVVAGLGRRGNTALFVSRGLGTVMLPVRLNCPPEVAILTLERKV
jgi:predicted MPP superfamily phosphohydrolase